MKQILLTAILFFSVLATGVASVLPPAGVSGQSPANVGQAYTYSTTQSFVIAPTWSVTAGTATINSEWVVGTTYYASITWTNNGTVTFFDEVAGGVSVYKNVVVVPLAPTVVNNQRCGTGTVTLSATPGTGGTIVRWYNATGTQLAEGTTYTTPSISATTTYYAATRNTAGQESTPRTPVTATITTTINAPTITNRTICTGDTVTLKATPGLNGTSCLWYSAPTGGSPIQGANSSYLTPALSTSTTYYISSSNTPGSCESTRAALTVTVGLPAAPSATTSATLCATGSATLTGTPGAGGTSIKWFTSPTGGELVYTGTSFATPSLTATTPYYAASVNAVGCLSTTRVVATATIGSEPVVVMGIQAGNVYVSGVVNLEAFAKIEVIGSGEPLDQDIDTTYTEVNWYATLADATAKTNRLSKGKKFTTPTLTQTTPYFIRLRTKEGSCWGTPWPTTATIIPLISQASIKTDVVRVPGKKTEASLTGLPDSAMSTVIAHFDGIGRVRQQIAVKASPNGKDVIQPIEYDEWGRSSKNYLGYVGTTTDGSFHSLYKAEQKSFYLASGDKIADDSAAYSLSVYEASPIGRMLEQGSVGKAWQPGTNHTQKIEYAFNATADNVRKFDKDGNSSGYYAAKTLSKTKAIDAEGNYSITFTDGSGNTILLRQFIDKTIEGTYTDYLETYYLYDDLGQLTYIVSPKGVAIMKAGTWDFASIKDAYCNQFVYDNKGRLIEKKVPGQPWQYVVYDPLGRVVLTQDGMLRSINGGQWAYVKYDYDGSAIMTGLYTNSSTRSALQSTCDTLYSKTASANLWFELQGSTHGYTNRSFPTSNTDVLSVSYFDDYDFDNDNTGIPTYVTESINGEHARAKYIFGLATGSKRKILGTSNWLYTYVFYDENGRVIQVRSDNHLNAGTAIDRVTNIYADDGRVFLTKKYHDAGSGKITTVLNTFRYDQQGRVQKVYQKNGTSSPQLVVQYEYNNIGQMVDKKLHGTGAPGSETFLQSVDYRFNIKGQLSSINNAQLTSDALNDDTNDYFGMELLYNTQESGLNNTALHNGNISAVKWKGVGTEAGTDGQRSYKYVYDKTGKLETATYHVNAAPGLNEEIGSMNESMTYDLNGNIQTLMRNQNQRGTAMVSGQFKVTSSAQAMDNLQYTYATADKNSLTKIEDNSGSTNGFNNASTATQEYTYDSNGNLTNDLNKGISNIVYNFLGKPTQMTVGGSKTINYTYDAAGNKLSMSVTQGGTTVTTDYANGFVYENGDLSFFGSPEGRVAKNGSSLEYQYSIADNQGNTRVVFTSVAPAAVEKKATFEGDANDNSNEFLNVVSTVSVAGNNTAGGNKVARMNQNYRVGPAKSVRVYGGDVVDLEVYAYYEASTGYGSVNAAATTIISAVAGAFGGVSGGAGESGSIFSRVNGAYATIGMAGNQGTTIPAAYLNYILFDNNNNVLSMGWKPVTSASNMNKARVYFDPIKITEAGYIYTYLSYENESDNFVYFDDFKVVHTKSKVVQYNEYYPFGLQTSNSWTREYTTGNNFLYNAANELNKDNGWYEMFYRGYDPATGRMLQIDPYAAMFASSTTYNYSLNNPVMMNDPSGGKTSIVGYTDGQLHTMFRQQRANGGTADFGQWAADILDFGDAGGRRVDGGDGGSYGLNGDGYFARWVWKGSYDVGFYSISQSGEKTWVPTGEILDVYQEQLIQSKSENIILNFSEKGARVREPGSGWKVITVTTLDMARDRLKGRKIRNLVIIGHANIDHITFGDKFNKVIVQNGKVITTENLNKLNSILQQVNSGGNVVFVACGADGGFGKDFGQTIQSYLRCDINVFLSGAIARLETEANSDYAVVWSTNLTRVSYSFRNITMDPEGCNRYKNITLNFNGSFNFIK